MLFSFIALALAMITLFWNGSTVEKQPGFGLAGYFWISLSVALAPWTIKPLIGTAILVLPSCIRGHASYQPACSKFCVARSTCPHFHT